MFNFLKRIFPKKEYTTLRILHTDPNMFKHGGFQNLEHIVCEYNFKGKLTENNLRELAKLLDFYTHNEMDYDFDGFAKITKDWLNTNGYKLLDYELQEIEIY